jgi:hypothetical protein
MVNMMRIVTRRKGVDNINSAMSCSAIAATRIRRTELWPMRETLAQATSEAGQSELAYNQSEADPPRYCLSDSEQAFVTGIDQSPTSAREIFLHARQ